MNYEEIQNSLLVPAQPCVCESTITSQNALQDEPFQPVLISFETEDEVSSQVVGGCKDTLTNDGYVFCNDEVTFYNPGMEMEYGEMENGNNETKETTIQIQIDSSHVHIDDHTEVSDCNASDRVVEKTTEFNIVNTSLENSRSMPMVLEGKHIILTKIIQKN